MSQLVTADAPVNQSVERAVRLLGCFSPDEPELSLAQLTQRLGTSRATTHRYTLALRRAGMLRFDAGAAVYALGPRIVELAAAALAGLRIVKIAGPHMERLVAELNETVVLSVWDGESPVVVRADDNTERLVRIVVRTGSRLDRRSSAQGKTYLAFGPAAVELDPAEVERIRSTRIAVNSQHEDGIRAIATPVFQGSEVAATLAVVGTIASLSAEADSPLAARLRRAAEALSAELGFLSDERSTA